MCDRFRRYKVGNLSDNVLMSGLFNIISIFLPFITLVFLNSGIVMMLRKQHIQVTFYDHIVIFLNFQLYNSIDELICTKFNISCQVGDEKKKRRKSRLL